MTSHIIFHCRNFLSSFVLKKEVLKGVIVVIDRKIFKDFYMSHINLFFIDLVLLLLCIITLDPLDQ